MGLFQWAVETYDRNEALVGVEIEGKTPLAPIGHILKNAQLEVTIDANGNFVSAVAVDKSEGKIIIPVTEDSAGRTVDPRAHPLCEQVGYLCPQNEKKYRLYVEQLTDWEESSHSHPKLKPILRYVKSGNIIRDLSEAGLITERDTYPAALPRPLEL